MNNNDSKDENIDCSIDENFISEFEKDMNNIDKSENLIEISDINEQEPISNTMIFYPQKKKKGKKKNNELIGEANELKKFNESLLLLK